MLRENGGLYDARSMLPLGILLTVLSSRERMFCTHNIRLLDSMC